MKRLFILALIIIFGLTGCELNRGDTSGDIAIEAPAAAAQTNATVWIEPATQQINAGAQTTTEIWVRDVANLAAVDLEIRFDPSLLQVIDADPGRDGIQIQPGDFMAADFVVRNEGDNAQGVIYFVVSQVAPTPPANGQGILALIQFESILPGLAIITVPTAQLANSTGQPIPVVAESGEIIMLSGVDARTPAPPTTPESTLQPEIPATPVLTPTATAITPTTVITQPEATQPPVEPAAPPAEPLPQTELVTPAPEAVVVEAPPVTPQPTTNVDIPPGATLGFCYTVRPGDTLYSLAQQYGTDPQFISTVNDLYPPGHIYQNQTLFMPTGYGRGPNVYIYIYGGTLDYVAEQCKLPVSMLARFNDLEEDVVLEANYPLIIPIPPFPPPSRYPYPLPVVPIPPPPCCGAEAQPLPQ